MIIDEWWMFHLTKDGWIKGSYKHDFQQEMCLAQPSETLLSRKYYERLSRKDGKLEIGFENIGHISGEARKRLKKYPHPDQFASYLVI